MPDYEVDPQPTGEIDPVAERVAGENLPYRGMVDHGVPIQHVESTDEAHYYSGHPVEYEDVPEPPDPIPVRIVQGAGSQEIRAFSTFQLQIPQNRAIQVVGREPNRKSVSLTALAHSLTAKWLWVGTDANVTAGTGWLLDVGVILTLTTTEPVWVFCDDPGLNTLAVLTEFVKDYT